MIRLAVVVGLIFLAAEYCAAVETITRSRNMSAAVARDGRIAIDAAGEIWIVPPGGGDADAVTNHHRSASRPRWSPDGLRIAYQANTDGRQGLWVYDLDDGHAVSVSRDVAFDIHPDWHPDGQRLVYAKDQTGTGFDLWEVDLPTGLHWRLTSHAGDETAPAWSADGRDLVYVHHLEDSWSLILRRHGQAEEILVSGDDKLAAPAWRPDGSLITYLQDGEAGTSLEMVILSQPRLVRTYAGDEIFVPAPVSWLDRHRMIYTTDSGIRQRLFNSWSSSPIFFRATLQPQASQPTARVRRELARIDEPPGRLVIHAVRLFDGLGNVYRANLDIVIDGGRISAVEPHAEHEDSIVIDMGNLTVLPGYVDAKADLERIDNDASGALFLTTGVTTIVAKNGDATHLNERWSSKEVPGPRILEDDGGLGETMTAKADSMTPGLRELLQSRQARLIGVPDSMPRRFAEPPTIEIGKTSVVLTSHGNHLEPGLALHAELRALTAAGLQPAQALRAAGVNAAAALGLDPFLGRIAVGAVADLVFVDGDPLNDIDDALKVVAVVRNGRFFSVAGLIERAAATQTVE